VLDLDLFARSQVTYGSVVKLMHEKTKHRLHSHDVAYGSGSGQQSVTGFPEGDDSNSYWVRIRLIASTSGISLGLLSGISLGLIQVLSFSSSEFQ
jgi:dolichyl-phosphate-mannose--protein O-mannosyl transferase